MTYQSTWWYPNYVEYGTGLNAPKTWPNVMEQYRRPDATKDLRHYDLPTENYEAMLYHRLPHLGKPVYRATFRDKPHTLARHYPGEDPHGKPVGFFGRVYYEDGPPQFKYDGPPKDDLYWLERPPLAPSFPKSRASNTPQGGDFDTMRGLNSASSSTGGSRVGTGISQRNRTAATSALPAVLTHNVPMPSQRPRASASLNLTGDENMFVSTYKNAYTNPTKRSTQDGVGYL